MNYQLETNVHVNNVLFTLYDSAMVLKAFFHQTFVILSSATRELRTTGSAAESLTVREQGVESSRLILEDRPDLSLPTHFVSLAFASLAHLDNKLDTDRADIDVLQIRGVIRHERSQC